MELNIICKNELIESGLLGKLTDSLDSMAKKIIESILEKVEKENFDQLYG